MTTGRALLRKLILIPGLLFAAACTEIIPLYDLEIRGATLVDPGAAGVLGGQCILIRGERIMAIEPCQPVTQARRVIQADRKWVIPGLWDMHVHATWEESVYRRFFADFVRFGIVGVRDMGGDPAVLQDARRYLSGGSTIGPELIAAGPFLDGPTPLNAEFSLALSTYDDGVRAVAAVASMGADFVKVYTQLPVAAVTGVFDEARRRGLPVAGHLPAVLNIEQAIRGGMQSIEHMAVEIGGICSIDDLEDTCTATFSALRDNGVYLTPTLVVRKRRSELDGEGIAARARVTMMPAVVAADWLSRQRQALAERSEADWASLREQYRHEQSLTTLAIAAGSLILAGTDAGDLFVPPGTSLHDELELLVGAGLSEKQALVSATTRATDFLGLRDRGRIEVGAIADLVILDADPLADIRNTRSIDAVIIKGRLVSND